MASSAMLWLAVRPRCTPALVAAPSAGVPYARLCDRDGSTEMLALDARPVGGQRAAKAAPLAGSSPQRGEERGEERGEWPALDPAELGRAARPGGTRLRLGVAPSAMAMSAGEGSDLTAAEEEGRRVSTSSLAVR